MTSMSFPPAKRYRQPVRALWWLDRPGYAFYIAREATAVFVAWGVVYLLMLVAAVGSGPEAYERFVEWSSSAWLIVLNIVALAFVVFHAVTWFALAPKAMVLRAGGRQIPPGAVLAGHYAAWIAVSAVIAWVVLA